LAKQSTQALIWCIIYTFLLLSYVTPLLILTIYLIMVPVLIMFTRLDLRLFILTYAISVASVYALTGPFGAPILIMSLFFLPPAIVMGTFYKKQAPVRAALTGGTVTLLAEFLLGLVVAYAAGLRPIDRVEDFLYSSIDSLPEVMVNTVNKAQLDLAVQHFIQFIPLLLITTSFFYVIVSHGIGRWVMRKLGTNVPGLPRAREWRMPKSFVWYFLIVMIMDFFISIESRSTLSMFVWNLLPILTMIFALQAIGFFFFVAHAKKWPVIVPLLGILALILFFPLVYLYSILGVLDVLLPIRKRITG